jgi:hypothetical protein
VSIDYDAAQEAIRDAVVAGTGLDDDQVMWAYNAYQGGERPVGERFVTLMLGPSTTLGVPGYTTDIDTSRPVGTEVELKSTVVQRFRIYIQCFGGTVIGSTSAMATLERFRNRLGLPSVRDLFTTAGISPFDSGGVTNIAHIEGTKFESRATLEVQCYIDASESDFCGFIDHVIATGTFYRVYGETDGAFGVTVDAEI